MKKTLLTLSALAFSLTSVLAQVSFEASEGFTPGTIDGQNNWGVSEGSPDSAQISDAYAADGTYSLSIIGLGSTEDLLGAFSPVAPVEGDIVTVSYDAYFPDMNDDGSDFYIAAQSPSQELLTSEMFFGYANYVGVYDVIDDVADYYIIDDVTFEGDTWIHVDVVHHMVTDPRIEYFMDGNLIYTGTLFGATNVEQLLFRNDDYSSSAYVDNADVYPGLPLSVKTNLANAFGVFPNPAKDVLTIFNKGNSTLKSVQIIDLNGRVVKTITGGMENSQVNVSDLGSGSYMVKIVAENGSSSVKKFIKE